MARTPAPDTRDRILDAASRLFREHGARAVGLQQIIDECGCGKNVLYREFASKDALVAAYLERCQVEWNAIMDAAIAAHDDGPDRQLVDLVRAVVRQVSTPGFRACPFRSTHAEFPDDGHPARKVAVDHVRTLRTRLGKLAERAGARDPRRLADQLTLIIDGLYSSGPMAGTRGPAAVAVALADDLVRASCGPPRGTDQAPSDEAAQRVR
jgi:AcrR family transcriptional regulator